ncbi:hypothetical protein D3C87_2109140 [compost metagenome]
MRSRLTHVALRVEQKGMIVTFHFALIGISQEILGDNFGGAEIKAGIGNRLQSVLRDPHLIDR